MRRIHLALAISAPIRLRAKAWSAFLVLFSSLPISAGEIASAIVITPVYGIYPECSNLELAPPDILEVIDLMEPPAGIEPATC